MKLYNNVKFVYVYIQENGIKVDNYGTQIFLPQFPKDTWKWDSCRSV